MTAYSMTLAGARTRCEYKIGNTGEASDRVDEWINDVIQVITSEVFFKELQTDGSDVITGDGSAQVFDLPEDFVDFVWVWDTNVNDYVEEVSFRALVEDELTVSTPTRRPYVYALMGRTGAAGGSSNVPVVQVKFDSILAAGYEVNYSYYRQHPLLVNDDDVILLPQNLMPVIVDGVLLEADQWSDGDRFAKHRDRYENRLEQLKKNQNRRPNLRRRMGSRGSSRPRRVMLPWNYPDIWYGR